MPNEFGWVTVSGEVAFITCAPRPLRVPMPGLNEELRVLTIRHRLPSGGENLLHRGIREQFVGSFEWDAIDTRADRLGRYKRIDGMRRCCVDANSLHEGIRNECNPRHYN